MSKDIKDIKKIAIAGAGGIGSHLTERLFDFGVNRNQFAFTDMEFTLFDDDNIEVKNLLHQNFQEQDLGKQKVDVMATKFAVTPQNRFMTKKDFENFDLIFSCVDSMVFRAELYKWSWKNPEQALWIDGRCESRQGIILNSAIAQKTLEKFLNDSQERKGCLLKYEKDNNIAHTLPVIVANSMVQVFLNVLRGDPVTNAIHISI